LTPPDAAAELGAAVVSAGRRAPDGRETIAGVRHLPVDVTDETSVRALFDEVGSLNHLFVSASPGAPGPFLEQDVAAARTFIDGKLLGSWACARYAATRMPPGASITFVTGCAVVRPPRNAAMFLNDEPPRTRCDGSPSSGAATSCARHGQTCRSPRSTPPTSPPSLRPC
jgi:hypothetical protein